MTPHSEGRALSSSERSLWASGYSSKGCLPTLPIHLSSSTISRTEGHLRLGAPQRRIYLSSLWVLSHSCEVGYPELHPHTHLLCIYLSSEEGETVRICYRGTYQNGFGEFFEMYNVGSENEIFRGGWISSRNMTVGEIAVRKKEWLY